MLNHGGGILAASRRYGIPVADWLDLSTGINPNGWPVPEIPLRAWLRLPETADGLEEAAASYYGSPMLLPVAGSQPAIQALPRLRAPGTVAVLDLTYGEHPLAWERQGHRVVRLAPDVLDAAADTADVMLICNPNNPTGLLIAPETLEHWRQRLAARGGWLVIDEAFMDTTPDYSMIPLVGQPGLVILRSIGKFFGLAGARVGFVFAWTELLEQLNEELGPWTISGPGRHAARGALLDKHWQLATRHRLLAASGRLATLLASSGLAPTGGAPLFQWHADPKAFALHTFLAEKGILTRYFAVPESVRFGLPATEKDWGRLAAALGCYTALEC